MAPFAERVRLLDDVFDRLVTPVVVLSRDGDVQLINAAAEAWLFESGVAVQHAAQGDRIDPAALPKDAVTCAMQAADSALLVQRPGTSLSLDPVSGLPNAAAAFTTLTKTLTTVGQLGGRLAVIHINCDLVRRMGISIGRLDAVELERAVGQRLRKLARRGDYACSLGQGSFCVLSVACEQLEDAWASAQRWGEALSKPFDLDGREIVCGVSVGVAVAPEHGNNAADLLDHAAAAAQQAAEAGRGEVRVYSASIATAMAEDIQLESALAQAMDHGELSLVFQPKLWADGQRQIAVGVECLLRWLHPVLGPISPARFIPLAERSGLMGALGDWITDRACEHIASWREQGLKPLPVAINVSGQQFLQSDFRWRVESCLRRHGLSAADISLEITESALLQDVDESIRLLRSLREMGVAIAVDDFGTGFSSLAYLRRFPCDLLKIDKTFVDGIEHDAQAAGILQAIVGMAKTLQMDVIAEGVESPAQFARLVELGCHHFQGYLFGRPEPPDSFAARWLQPQTEPRLAAAG